MAKKRVTSRPGLFGTVYYYDENGKPIGKSRPGLFKGTRVYSDQDGKYVGASRPGFFAKEVFTDTEQNHITTYGSPLGEVHFKTGEPIGRTMPGFFDSEHTTFEADDEDLDTEDWDDEYCDEDDLTEDITAAAPEEAYADENWNADVPPSPRNTLMKKLQLLLLFLVILTVTVYACTSISL